MSALTIATRQPVPAAGYLNNVAHAALALLNALLNVPAVSKPAAPSQRVAKSHDLSLFRLYSLASPYDSVSPSLAQELRVLASRD